MVYQVIKNGNEFVAAFDDFMKAQRKLRTIAKRGDYVELWSLDPEFNTRKLLAYEN